ncbi:thrombin inhibitor hemalin-like [Erythrolamprus reginae]|uniref:thrombin inhibitor hemalin-like n=1 Tax=Erythrolamprus reginae TaxID=121349 RepID=UPI00396CF7B1
MKNTIYVLLTFGLLIFYFRDVSSKDLYRAKCTLGVNKGRCQKKLTRYYFHLNTKKCEMFAYSGCGGNANNFKSLEQCKSECPSHGEKWEEMCNHSPDVGRCRAEYHHFYFNTATGNCEEFIYSGCKGNKNNYRTWLRCRDTCLSSDPIPRKCTLPRRITWCLVPRKRYYFNMTTGTCTAYIYPECAMNENSFFSIEECQNVCLGKG